MKKFSRFYKEAKEAKEAALSSYRAAYAAKEAAAVMIEPSNTSTNKEGTGSTSGNPTADIGMMIEEAMPFYKLWVEIETNYTSGDGYLDKLCMELVGLPSSRCRPPTRDMREKYRQKTLDYMKKIKVPHLKF